MFTFPLLDTNLCMTTYMAAIFSTTYFTHNTVIKKSYYG